jgi:hypothetical protein
MTFCIELNWSGKEPYIASFSRTDVRSLQSFFTDKVNSGVSDIPGSEQSRSDCSGPRGSQKVQIDNLHEQSTSRVIGDIPARNFACILETHIFGIFLTVLHSV